MTKTKRTWAKVKAGVYTSGGYTVESKYDRAAGGTMWRLTSTETPGARYVWFATLAQAKDHVADLEEPSPQPEPTFVERVAWALDYVNEHGFGDNVDADSLIAEAAACYLDLNR